MFHDRNDWISYYRKRMLTPERVEEYLRIYEPYDKTVEKYCPAPAKTLEIGCGGARLSTCLSLRGYNVIATDLNDDILNIGRENGEKYGKNMQFQVMDALKLADNFPKNSFDVCTHHGVIEHFEKWEIHNMLQQQLEVSEFVIFGLPIKTDANLKRFKGDNIYRNLWTLEEWRDNILLPFNIIEIFEVTHKSDDLICVLSSKT